MIPVQPVSERQAAGCSQCREGAPLDFEFDYAYQPIVDVRRRAVYGHEALVRGPNGESAYSVLSQVTDANRYQFDQSCRVKAVAGAARLGITEFLAINFMPNAMYRAELCIRTTLEAARKYDFPVQNIIFEVSEGEQIQDRAHLVAIFKEYERLGFRTAIDDFGAGYSGLNLLADYQPDIIKIDMGLVHDIDKDPVRQAIVRGIIAIGCGLGRQLLAEGVETRAERDFLAAEGIALMQGYLFCKPAFRAIGTIDPSSWD